MNINGEDFERYKSNSKLYFFITREWVFRNQSDGKKIFGHGGQLFAFSDGKLIEQLIVYYEELERYENCYWLKRVLDDLNTI